MSHYEKAQSYLQEAGQIGYDTDEQIRHLLAAQVYATLSLIEAVVQVACSVENRR